MAKMQLNNGFAMNMEVLAGMLPMDTVFMHGNLASNTWWQPAVEVWKKNQRPGLEGRMMMGEWRGCGQSDAQKNESELHPSQLADDYLMALRQLGVKKACIVGHSTGGLVALYAMMKAPEMFDRAVLLDPVSAKGVQFDNSMYDAFTQMSKDRAFCEAVMGGTIHGNDPTRALFQKIVDEAQLATQRLGHGVLNALKGVNIFDQLSSITHPVLVMHGEQDPVLPKEGSIEMAGALGNARYMEMKDQGHSTNVENPTLFVKTVDEFLFNRP